MKLSHLRRESGFTLMELMVASVCTMIVLGSAVALTSQIQNGYRRQIENSAGEQEARYAMEWIGRHLRGAGNNPFNVLTANVCPGSTNFRGIIMDPNTDGVNDDITVQSDINPPDKRVGGTSPNCNQTGEHVTISFDAANNTIVFRDEAVPGAGTARTDNVIGGLRFVYLDAFRAVTTDQNNIFYVQTRITIRSRTINAAAGAADTRVLTSEVRGKEQIMKTTIQSASERGIALVVVLLLMAVLSGLATGFAMTGQVEVQMGTNEVYFAGARAAAEAGLNRAIVEIVANTNTNLLSGPDGAVDAATPTAAVNADNGSVVFLMGGAGPYPLGTTGQYSYNIEILDDDNPLLYESGVIDLAQMEEDGSLYTNINKRLVLRATGFGPNGTVVRIARVLEHDPVPGVSTSSTSSSNPALLINGDFEMNGGILVSGTNAGNGQYGSVHANGSLRKTGAGGTVTGSVTASGTTDLGSFTPGGASGGGRAAITVPNIRASDFLYLADYKLAVVAGVGVVQTYDASLAAWTACSTAACSSTGWTYSAGTWNMSATPGDGTYYAEGNVDIGPTKGGSNKPVSVLATGDINMHGSAELTPENAEKIQFVCDGDLDIKGDLDAPADIDGQILVRGQFDAGGSLSFQGRIIVQDVQGAGSLYDANTIHGAVKFYYGGGLGAIETETITTTSTTYFNNVTGWMEQ